MSSILAQDGSALLDQAGNALLTEARERDTFPVSSMTVFVASGAC